MPMQTEGRRLNGERYLHKADGVFGWVVNQPERGDSQRRPLTTSSRASFIDPAALPRNAHVSFVALRW